MPKTDLATLREKLSDVVLGVHDFMLFTGNATLAAAVTDIRAAARRVGRGDGTDRSQRYAPFRS